MSKNLERSLALVPTDSSGSGRGLQAQKVAPFLQKLFQMVDDPESQHLMRWSDAGDSISIIDRDRLAREVLPRWFKHSNYPTFVRQLNMYGFRKVPRLHQGALIPASGTGDVEVEDYENEHFRRGQPDLLALISRKGGGRKEGEGKGKEADMLVDGVELGEGDQDLTITASPTSHSVPSIVSSIAEIKRNQTAVSAELSALRQENQALWQDALRMRELHRDQQETINRIMMFLAGVFGKGGIAGGAGGRGRGIMPAQRGGDGGNGRRGGLGEEDLGEAFSKFGGNGERNEPGLGLGATAYTSQTKPRKRRRLSQDEVEQWDHMKGGVGHELDDISGEHVGSARVGGTPATDIITPMPVVHKSLARFTIMDDSSSSASSPPDTTSLHSSPVMTPKSVASDSARRQSFAQNSGNSAVSGAGTNSTSASTPSTNSSVASSGNSVSQELFAPQPQRQVSSQPQPPGIMQRAQEYTPEPWQTFFDALNLGPQHNPSLMPTFASPALPTATSKSLAMPTQMPTQMRPQSPLNPIPPTQTYGQTNAFTQVPISSPGAIAHNPGNVTVSAALSNPAPSTNTSTALVPQQFGVPSSASTDLGQRAYTSMQNAADLEARIGSTQASIDELVANLGLDPAVLAGLTSAESGLGTGDIAGGNVLGLGGGNMSGAGSGIGAATPPTVPGLNSSGTGFSGSGGQMDFDEFMKLLGEMS